MTERKKQSSINRIKQGWQRLSQEAEGAVRRLREGRMGSPYHTPFQLLGKPNIVEIRRYQSRGASMRQVDSPTLILVAPWPMTPELFDIAPELSAIEWLLSAGIDVWTLSAHSPHLRRDGKETELLESDILFGLTEAIVEIHQQTARGIHLLGYSHSGQWIYQLAATAPEGVIESVITFGVPADSSPSTTQRARTLAGGLISQVWRGLRGNTRTPEQLPEAMESYGVTVHEAHPQEETHHLFRLLGLLPKDIPQDDATSTQASLTTDGLWGRLGGWLGKRQWPIAQDPAIASIKAMRCPVLCIVGNHDAVVTESQIRKLKQLAPQADVHEKRVDTGHFGLVVGPRAMAEVWPLLPQWVAWTQDGQGPPAFLHPQQQETAEREAIPQQATKAREEKRKGPFPVQRLYDMATDIVDGLWNKLEEVTFDVGSMVEAIRWQLPRMARLVSLTPDAKVSMSLALAEQASALPQEIFFAWNGREWTYQETESWVEGMAQALAEQGIHAHTKVALACGNHPGTLMCLIALNRIGVSTRIFPDGADMSTLETRRQQLHFDVLILDGTQPHEATSEWPAGLRVLHFPYPRCTHPALTQLSLHPTPDPQWLERDTMEPWAPGQGEAIAAYVWTGNHTNIVALSNRHWGLAALGAAAAAGLTSEDEVASTLPLGSSAGLFVAAGSAMLGGARLTLLDAEPSMLQHQLQAAEASVVFASDNHFAMLASFPIPTGPQTVRALIGTGITTGIADALRRRYPEASLLSGYSSTETNFALANLRDDKPGALGRPLLGQAALLLVPCDLTTKTMCRTPGQPPTLCRPNQPGLLLSKAPTERPFPYFEGYVHRGSDAGPRMVTDVLEPGDQWYLSDDLLRQDQDGDYWFVDRLDDAFQHPATGEAIYPFQTTQALLQIASIAYAATGHSTETPWTDEEPVWAVVELAVGHSFQGRQIYAHLEQNVPSSHLPWRIRICPKIPTTTHGTLHRSALEKWRQQSAPFGTLYQRNDGTKRYQRIL